MAPTLSIPASLPVPESILTKRASRAVAAARDCWAYAYKAASLARAGLEHSPAKDKIKAGKTDFFMAEFPGKETHSKLPVYTTLI